MQELICITCPKGCHLKVTKLDGACNVQGNLCERGKEYAIKELTAPTRVITSTVRCSGGHIPRLPVKTDRDIPKERILQAMRLLDDVIVSLPIRAGEVVVPHLFGSDASFVATRTITD